MRRTKWMHVLAVLAAVGWFAGSRPAAAKESAAHLAHRIQALYHSAGDYTAAFVQDMNVRAYGRTEHDEGRSYFKKPGKMRWETLKQGRLVQLVVTDGRTIWFYSPVDNQVLEDALGHAFSKTPVNFLAGLGNLERDFEVRLAKDPHPALQIPGTTLLSLVPKSKDLRQTIQDLEMAVDPKTAQVVGFSMADALGNVTKVRLENIRLNQGLPDHLFEFHPPKGVDVVRPPSR